MVFSVSYWAGNVLIQVSLRRQAADQPSERKRTGFGKCDAGRRGGRRDLRFKTQY